MSPPSELNQDAFISYRHDNNQFVDEDGKGWVDHFHERLELQLNEFTGHRVEIWRDKRLSQNSVLVTYLRDELKQTVALIAVLSPGYLRSEWCMGELREFCTRAMENGGLHLNGKSRIFAVVKLPPDGDAYPDEISGQLKYEFFSINRETRRPDEFSPDLGRNKDQRYWNTLSTLAWDLKELLRETGRLTPTIGPGENIFAVTPPTPKKTIYLAETTDDLAEQRRQIKEELILHGYEVLPQRPLPYALNSYTDEVKKNLARCEASINLLGRTYGLIPDGAGDRSILRLQLELANECARERSRFKRLIWTPEGWEAADDKLHQMMRQVKLLADPHNGVEFLQTSLEEFKTLMHKRLTVSLNGHGPKSAVATNATDTPAELRKVYLICDRRDVIDAKPLISYLQKDRRYEVVLPEFEETEGDTPLADLHQQNLLECDGVIVYYGNGSSRWASAKRSDIEKHAGLEKTVQSARIRPLRAKLFYVTLPFTDLKDVFDTQTAQVIKNFGAFDPAVLSDFINDLEGDDDEEGGNADV